MKIQYKNYLMTPNEGSSDRFDLEKIVHKTRKKDSKDGKKEGEIYEGSDDMGYSMRLTTCMERIIDEETDSSFRKEEVIELKDYIREYIRQKEELISYIDKTFNIKLK